MGNRRLDQRLDPVLEQMRTLKKVDNIASVLVFLGMAAVVAYFAKTQFRAPQPVETRRQVVSVMESDPSVEKKRRERERRQDDLVSGAVHRFSITFENEAQAEEYLRAIVKRLEAIDLIGGEELSAENQALVSELSKVMGALAYLCERGEGEEWCSQVNLRLSLLRHADRCEAYHRFIRNLRVRSPRKD